MAFLTNEKNLYRKENITNTEYLLANEWEDDYLKAEKFHDKKIKRFDYKLEYIKGNNLILVSKSEVNQNNYVKDFTYIKVNDKYFVFSDMNNVIYDIIAWESNLGHFNIVVNKEKVDSYIKLLKQLDNFF
jgi:hypothetical protein